MNWVPAKLDLKQDIQFETTIERAHLDEGRGRSLVRTDTGETIDTQHLVAGCFMRSAALENVFPGQSRFTGRIFITARWPKATIDFKGKRVDVVVLATGSDAGIGALTRIDIRGRGRRPLKEDGAVTSAPRSACRRRAMRTCS